MRNLKFKLLQKLIDAQEEVKQEEKVATGGVGRLQEQTNRFFLPTLRFEKLKQIMQVS